jgi:hypothetical protein
MAMNQHSLSIKKTLSWANCPTRASTIIQSCRYHDNDNIIARLFLTKNRSMQDPKETIK